MPMLHAWFVSFLSFKDDLVSFMGNGIVHVPQDRIFGQHTIYTLEQAARAINGVPAEVELKILTYQREPGCDIFVKEQEPQEEQPVAELDAKEARPKLGNLRVISDGSKTT